MRRILILIVVTLIGVGAYAASPMSRYELKVGDFDELKVVDGINVEYVCDSNRAGLVEFETTKELASAVIFEPSKGKLSVKLASRETPYQNLPLVRVYSSQLVSVSNEGDSLVRIVSLPQNVRFSCRVMGNGTLSVRDLCAGNLTASILSGRGVISIFGHCDKASLKIAGAGSIQADELEAKTVSCSMAGTGTINCYATSLLEVGGLGGTVNYRGTPEVKKRFLSTAKINPID